ncbi:MAG: hypothetical protein RBU21_12825 [FCB group bacterium]|jgi:tetratricopeptide (TPR) repeat protein|nr:hypothetical protein [FCB group bacterium]
MPVSTSIHISHCLTQILALQPRSVLDIGCGFGLWGFLCREYLDVFSERVQPADWQVKITGVELFDPYIMAHQRSLYNRIEIGDIRDLAARLEPHELVIAGDVIEHLDKPDAQIVLRQLYDKAERAMLVNIPIGSGWEHGVVHDNPGELHRSEWHIRDFDEFLPQIQLFGLPCGAYGSFYCEKNHPDEHRVNIAMLLASRAADGRDFETAFANLRVAHRLAPGNEVVCLDLANLLLERHELQEAVNVLRASVSANPAFHEGYLNLARLLAALQRKDEARQYAEPLLTLPGVSSKIREDAINLLTQLRGNG